VDAWHPPADADETAITPARLNGRLREWGRRAWRELKRCVALELVEVRAIAGECVQVRYRVAS
jgi:hypothetical protein